MSISNKIAKLNALRARVMAGENPFQVGIPLGQWIRIRSGGDWKMHEVACGIPSETWDTDKYGDFYKVPGAGTLTFEAPGIYVARWSGGEYRTFYWAYGMDFLRRLLEPRGTDAPEAPVDRPPRPLPHIIPWHTARILDFELPATVFISDAADFLRGQASDDTRTAIMALMTSFANMPRQEQEANAGLWDTIAGRLVSSDT